MVSIRLWITHTSIISVRRRKLAAVVDLREAIERGESPATVGAFVTCLTDGLTARMNMVISDLSDQVDALEEASLDAENGLRTRLANVRRTTIVLRRYIGPQRDALAQLIIEGRKMHGETPPLFSTDDQVRLRETVDQISRMIEEMDAIRERCAILHDQLTDQRAEDMNRNMMILSVVAAVFLPLGFLTGLLGVNIGGVPGTDYSSAFAIFCAAILVMTGALVWWFYKKGWL